ncbi:MAG: hypothetical protein KGZ85_15965 [Ignavibacterium sp.]|jgi:uncharacterized membrane protein YkgB|nr:hypothetical protein [Ignavibacterium sp.]
MNLNKIDNEIASFMKKWGVIALRISLGIIFIWFGVLKTVGISPAEPLVKATVGWMPFFTTDGWVVIIGWWEVIIGVSFLFQKTIRIAIALLAMQMAGTFMPLIILTEVTFQSGGFPYAPTLEGQYIIKNLLIISAALVIGGTVRKLNE